MAKTDFNPVIISKQLLLALRKRQVGAQLINRNYQGDVARMGDQVKIMTPAGLTIGSYSGGTDITVQELDGAAQVLTVDQGDYFAFYADDTENIAAYVDAFVAEGGYGLSDKADQYILGAYADADLSVAFDPSADDVLAMAREVRRKMSLANAPEQGRWLVLSPEEIELVDEKLTGRATAGGDAVVAAGFRGYLYGLAVYESNNLTEAAGVRHALAGHNSAITFADAIVSVESMRAQNRFADLIRGLHVYGMEVIRPEILCRVDIDVA